MRKHFLFLFLISITLNIGCTKQAPTENLPTPTPETQEEPKEKVLHSYGVRLDETSCTGDDTLCTRAHITPFGKEEANRTITFPEGYTYVKGAYTGSSPYILLQKENTLALFSLATEQLTLILKANSSDTLTIDKEISMALQESRKTPGTFLISFWKSPTPTKENPSEKPTLIQQYFITGATSTAEALTDPFASCSFFLGKEEGCLTVDTVGTMKIAQVLPKGKTLILSNTKNRAFITQKGEVITTSNPLKEITITTPTSTEPEKVLYTLPEEVTLSVLDTLREEQIVTTEATLQVPFFQGTYDDSTHTIILSSTNHLFLLPIDKEKNTITTIIPIREMGLSGTPLWQTKGHLHYSMIQKEGKILTEEPTVSRDQDPTKAPPQKITRTPSLSRSVSITIETREKNTQEKESGKGFITLFSLEK